MGSGAAVSQQLTKWRRLLYEPRWRSLATAIDQRLKYG
jgi:hypothetical protein